MAELADPNAFVYFIHAPSVGRVKIGYSAATPDDRFTAIYTGSPVALERLGLIAGSYYLEQILHARFAPHRAHLEWFQESDELMGFVRDHAAPWAAGVVHPGSLPSRAQQAVILRADRWFARTARRLARLAIVDPLSEELSHARQLRAMLDAFPAMAGEAREARTAAIKRRDNPPAPIQYSEWLGPKMLRSGVEL